MFKLLLSIAINFVFLILFWGPLYAQPAICDESPEIDLWFDDLSITYTPEENGGTNTVVLDDFSASPYQDALPPFGILYPPIASPANWPWTVGGTSSPGYVGYGPPATLTRDTTVFFSGPASWHFNLPANANNLDDIYEPTPATNCGGDRPNQFLCDEGPILMTILRDQPANSRRTLDQVLSDLSEPPINYAYPVTFSVRVRARWDDSVPTRFNRIEQGINVFNHSGAISNINHKVYQPWENDTGWFVASIQVSGIDDRFQFGIRGSLDYTPGCIPTMTQWGMIVFVVLAGLGAVYYIRRQRRVEK